MLSREVEVVFWWFIGGGGTDALCKNLPPLFSLFQVFFPRTDASWQVALQKVQHSHTECGQTNINAGTGSPGSYFRMAAVSATRTGKVVLHLLHLLLPFPSLSPSTVPSSLDLSSESDGPPLFQSLLISSYTSLLSYPDSSLPPVPIGFLSRQNKLHKM